MPFEWITDGLSNTLLIGEKHVRPGHLGEAGDGDQAYYSGFDYTSAQRSAGYYYETGGRVDNPLMGPNDPAAPARFGSWHPGLCNFVFCDGSVHALPVNLDIEVLCNLSLRNDGKAVSADSY